VALASRYRDEPAVGGYNLLNEPGDPTGKTVKSFYDRTVAAIREVDSRHIILLDGNRYATDFSAFSPGDYYYCVINERQQGHFVSWRARALAMLTRTLAMELAT
jgi:hypothetical protein